MTNMLINLNHYNQLKKLYNTMQQTKDLVAEQVKYIDGIAKEVQEKSEYCYNMGNREGFNYYQSNCYSAYNPHKVDFSILLKNTKDDLHSFKGTLTQRNIDLEQAARDASQLVGHYQELKNFALSHPNEVYDATHTSAPSYSYANARQSYISKLETHAQDVKFLNVNINEIIGLNNELKYADCHC